MRLLNVESLELRTFHASDTPRYVIASHRGSDEEVTFKDVHEKRNSHKSGYMKIVGFANYIKKHVSPIKWLWIDTCCINKGDPAELSHPINSMYSWYRNAELCIAYLADVEEQGSLKSSVWFERGWTLQELLAPRIVVFVTDQWQVIGNKGSSSHSCSITPLGSDLTGTIAAKTGIPTQVLSDWGTSANMKLIDKLKWMEGRRTTVPEDMAYALFGVLGVAPGADYGEGSETAMQRLEAAVNGQSGTSQQIKPLRELFERLKAPDPWTNHQLAQGHHEPNTGTWLLHSRAYQTWKSGAWEPGSSRCLWLHGKPGSGKTVLCSTAVEDSLACCRGRPYFGYAVFYFSFSDESKQDYLAFLTSLLEQLGQREPGLGVLRMLSVHAIRTQDWLEDTLRRCIASYQQVFLHVDALDECSRADKVREHVLVGLETLVATAPNIRVLVTSRAEPDIREYLQRFDTVSIEATTADQDIRLYVSERLSRHSRLSLLPLQTRNLVEDTLTQKANGMFRWVDCQLAELEKLKSLRPTSIKAKLSALPEELDQTYERMLNRIKLVDRPYALTIFRWVTYAESPRTLLELTEADVIDPTRCPTADGDFDVGKKYHWKDALEILGEFLLVEHPRPGDENYNHGTLFDEAEEEDLSMASQTKTNNKHVRVHLAHFSVNQYLQSTLISTGHSQYFHLIPAREHTFLTQSCITYLMYYSDSTLKACSKQDLDTFPLLRYAAKSWSYHASRQQWTDATREARFLTSERYKHDWLRVHNPEEPLREPFDGFPGTIGSGLHYASFFGLGRLVEILQSDAWR
ncbi:Vegetative incompatibility protein HET-E-1 [Fulvia fulva]|uniref:Vegetative incompatibility protein HET-E-1 n=1 Tax=Passalora fulva TaxID=5499 RepID=A0A9Q8PKL8_PASFU|nr:Vegetative incompatibility protein HET-E-1 [Fulvia fulva]KAK4611479.1 Vegetative incompatibility protein HET-E-1 [Fulvia fulva]UJO24246.1 Vegetative incompatibility protein HET-E-1 [Fulvia fulva]